MPTFMILARFTDETATTFAKKLDGQGDPNEKPVKKFQRLLKELAQQDDFDGRLDSLFFTAGDPDVVLVITMPSQRAAVSYAYTITAAFGLRTTTLPAFDASDAEIIFQPKVGGP